MSERKDVRSRSVECPSCKNYHEVYLEEDINPILWHFKLLRDRPRCPPCEAAAKEQAETLLMDTEEVELIVDVDL